MTRALALSCGGRGGGASDRADLEEAMKHFPTCSLTTGALLFAGDWAWSHGDLEVLSFVAQELSTRVGEPLRLELADLMVFCRCDEELATRRWPQLRKQLVR